MLLFGNDFGIDRHKICNFLTIAIDAKIGLKKCNKFDLCLLLSQYVNAMAIDPHNLYTLLIIVFNHPVYGIHIIIPIIGKCIKKKKKNHSECSRESIALRFVAGPVRGTKYDEDHDQEQMTCNLLIMLVPKFFISFMFTSFCTGNATINHSSDRILCTSQNYFSETTPTMSEPYCI